MSEQEDKSGVNLADPDSLLGLLQRGRGKGYLLALERPAQEVWPLLLECVTNDPRFDRQCEFREDYYASLILKTGMDLEPLRSFVKENDGACDSYGWEIADLALKTLASLAGQGSGEALAILREYTLYGCDWEWATVALSDSAVPGALEEIGEILYRRIRGAPDLYSQFRSTVEEHWGWYCRDDRNDRLRARYLLPMCEPWKALCHESASLADLFARIGLPYDQPPASHKTTDADVVGLSVADLLSSADTDGFYPRKRVLVAKVTAADEDRLLESLVADNPYRVRLAFYGLGKLGTMRAFEAVKSYIEASENADSRVRRSALEAIEQMPGSLSLETARQWFARKEWYLQVAGGGILEEHATFEDVPLLIQALRAPETVRREDSRLPSALRALARFEGFGRIPELEQVFCQAGDSYDRRRAADAMAKTSPEHFTAEYVFECLWDCHWGVRETGCVTVALSTPGAIERLREIAADPSDCEDTREAAKTRLETAAGQASG